jgi:hypothetical protein
MNPNIYLIYIFLFASFFFFGCNFPLFETSRKEYYRVKSPDGEVSAVLMESNGGATTSFGYDLFIIPKDVAKVELSPEYSKFRADRTRDLKITWIENKILQIDCKSARIFSFSNFWQSKNVQDYQYLVEIKISPTCRL